MKLSFIQILYRGFLAGAFAFAGNWIIALLTSQFFHLPSTFAPFTAAPLLSGCFGGALLGSLVYYPVQFVPRISKPLFVLLAIFALVASFYLPYRLSYTSSPRFAGANPQVQLVLSAMHLFVALCTLFFLFRKQSLKRSKI